MTDRPATPGLSRRERILKNIAILATRLVYRSVEVRQQPGETATGPQLTVSNHFGGFADALIQAYALDRVPRFIARDVIWRIPIAKQVMKFARAIPTHKPEDKGPAGNDQMFGSTYEALREGDLIMIFPEGVTVDDPSMARIKTGAARIALGARASGVEGIKVIPSGIHYDDKASLRSKVWVNVGSALDLDAEIERFAPPGTPQDASNHGAVRALTAAIEERLRRSAPDYVNWEEERALSEAATIALRTVPEAAPDVDYGDESDLANLLSQRPPEAKEAIAAALDRYTADLDAAGLNDRQMATSHQSRSSFFGRMAGNLVIGLLLLPFALAGLVINFIPFLLLWLIGRVKLDPAVAATVKPGAAIVLFSISWGVAGWAGWTWSGIEGIAAVLLVMPLYLFALFALTERGRLIWRAWRGWWGAGRGDLHESVLQSRRAVVEAVVEAI
ncbi:MAG: 1-acyl-sn-glycerol-3-phosphate acyltransferase [Actinomycetota bacterium]|nr:1-acyl-sn-glycerol-3-phosphate acyltransferase [Actinomycetota bacterium]